MSTLKWGRFEMKAEIPTASTMAVASGRPKRARNSRLALSHRPLKRLGASRPCGRTSAFDLGMSVSSQNRSRTIVAGNTTRSA